MTKKNQDREPSDALSSLKQKINLYEEENFSKVNEQEKSNKYNENIRAGFKVSVEIISILLTSVFLGLIIDHFFGTTPLGFILLFLLGIAAGLWNAYKSLVKGK